MVSLRRLAHLRLPVTTNALALRASADAVARGATGRRAVPGVPQRVEPADYPTGKSVNCCPAPFAKIFLFSPDPNQFTDSRRPVPNRGAFRDRHGRGAGCGGRGRRADERAGSRTAKSCGSDAPTLASSWRKKFPQATVANKPGHRGEHEGNHKTIARGMPG